MHQSCVISVLCPFSDFLDRVCTPSPHVSGAVGKSNAVYLGLSKNISTLSIRSVEQTFPKRRKDNNDKFLVKTCYAKGICYVEGDSMFVCVCKYMYAYTHICTRVFVLSICSHYHLMLLCLSPNATSSSIFSLSSSSSSSSLSPPSA